MLKRILKVIGIIILIALAIWIIIGMFRSGAGYIILGAILIYSGLKLLKWLVG